MVLLACSSSSEDRPVPTVKAATVAKPPRHQVLAEKLIAAIAANDLKQLEPLFSKIGWSELADLTRESLRDLRRKLDEEQIDLAAANIVKVEAKPGLGTPKLDMESVDITLVERGRTFRLGFTAMAKGADDYTLVGFATYIE